MHAKTVKTMYICT